MIGGGPNLHVAVAIALGRPTSDRDDALLAEIARRLERPAPPRRDPLRDRLAAVLERPDADTTELVDALYRRLARPPRSAPAEPVGLFDLAEMRSAS